MSARIRERRIMLGMTQQQLAELIGVTYQQAHKYETGANRISAGRLHRIAQVLGVDLDYFYKSQSPKQAGSEPVEQQRLLLELARSFQCISSPEQQAALYDLVRAMARRELQPEQDGGGSLTADAHPT